MSFHYLFKFIVIGDTGTNHIIQGLASRVLFNNLSNKKLTKSMMSPLVSNLLLKLSMFIKRFLSCRFGIQLARKILDLSPGRTIEVPLELFWSMISPGFPYVI